MEKIVIYNVDIYILMIAFVILFCLYQVPHKFIKSSGLGSSSFQFFSPMTKKLGMMKLPQMISETKRRMNMMFMKLRLRPINKSLTRITKAKMNPVMVMDLNKKKT